MDIDRIAVLILIALQLAVMRTYPGGNHRHRIVLEEDSGRAIPVAFTQLRHVSRNIRIARALMGAWCKTGLHATIDGVITVLSLNREALFTTLTCTVESSTDAIRIAVEPATHILTEITTDGSFVTDDRRSDGFRCFLNCRCSLRQLRTLHDLCQFRQGTDFDRISFLFNIISFLDGFQIDNLLWCLLQDLFLHHTDEVCTSGDGHRLTGFCIL